MKLPTTVCYATRAMTALASGEAPEHPVSARHLGEAQDISPKFLEHILKSLKAAGLVLATPGMRGGYVLSKPPEEITVKDIYECLIGSTAPTDCVDNPALCPRSGTCPARELWVEIKKAIENIITRTTVQDLVERKRRKMAENADPMYYI